MVIVFHQKKHFVLWCITVVIYIVQCTNYYLYILVCKYLFYHKPRFTIFLFWCPYIHPYKIKNVQSKLEYVFIYYEALLTISKFRVYVTMKPNVCMLFLGVFCSLFVLFGPFLFVSVNRWTGQDQNDCFRVKLIYKC